MPNWTQNDLVITGTKEAIDGVYGLLGEKFDFNKIIPMPKELQDDTHREGTDCPKCGKKFEGKAMNSQSEHKIYDWKCSDCDISDNIGGRLGSTMFDSKQDIYKQLSFNEKIIAKKWEQKYGTASWYEWSNKNWNTKWNVTDDSTVIRKNNTEIRAYFPTAWDAPYPVLEELSKMFDVKIMHKYEHEDGNEQGVMCYESGHTEFQDLRLSEVARIWC